MNAAQTHLDFLNAGYLHSLDTLPASVINTLETAPPPVPSGSAAISNVAAAHVQSPQAELPKQKKTRMSRVPKGVTPGVTPPPDPERWLKKSERTTFNQGSNRRRKAVEVPRKVARPSQLQLTELSSPLVLRSKRRRNRETVRVVLSSH